MSIINVDFVIPTLNINSERLTVCRNSILSQVGLFESKIFIEEGYGFARGVNKGIKRGENPYIAIINDDVKLAPDWLQEASHVFEKNPDCAAVATRVLSFDGQYIDSCGMDYKMEGMAIKRGNGLKDNKSRFDKIEEVFGVPCSAALLKREALEKVKLFDEDFIAYEEDVDISFRLRLMGFAIFYAPKAVAFHKMHATSSLLGNFKVRMDAKNWIYIIIKNYPFSLMAKFAVQIFIERFRNLSGLIKQTYHIYKWKCFWVIPLSLLTTYGAVIIGFPKMLQKRFEIQKARKLSYSDLICLTKYE